MNHMAVNLAYTGKKCYASAVKRCLNFVNMKISDEPYGC